MLWRRPARWTCRFSSASAPCSVTGSRSSSPRTSRAIRIRHARSDPDAASLWPRSVAFLPNRDIAGFASVLRLRSRWNREGVPMIWAILAILGVPLWLCAAGLSVLVMRNRAIRHRPGNVTARRRRQGKSRWTRGHGVWVHEVFAFRGSPAAWAESLIAVRDVVTLSPTASDRKKLRALDAAPLIVRLIDDDGEHVDFATTSEHALDLLGSFAPAAAMNAPVSPADLPPGSGAESG